MAINVHLEDHTGNERHRAKLVDDAPVAKLIPALVTALGLPITDPSGRPVTYRLSHNNRQLQEDDTLLSAGVQTDDTITIVPEMTAGNAPRMQPLPQTNGFSLVSLGGSAGKKLPRTDLPPFATTQFSEQRLTVSLRKEVLKEIANHAALHSNREVGGILFGEVFEQEGRFLVAIEAICRAHDVLSSCSSLQFTGESWLGIFKQRLALPEMKTLGWYHSHPGWGTYPSEIDRFSHESFFAGEPWYVALVIDPSSHEVDVFRWDHAQLLKVPLVIL